MTRIGSFANMFNCSAEELEAFLQDEEAVKSHANLCYQVGRLIMPDTDEEPLTDEENVEFFKFMVKKAIEEKRRLEKR